MLFSFQTDFAVCPLLCITLPREFLNSILPNLVNQLFPVYLCILTGNLTRITFFNQVLIFLHSMKANAVLDVLDVYFSSWVLRCYGQMIECALVDYTTINWLVKQQNINIMFFFVKKLIT